MPAFLIIFLAAAPLVELYVLIKIGQWIGALQTVALVIFMGFAGAALVRLQGIAVFLSFQETLSRGKIPADQMLDGLLVASAGILLIFPGLLSDIAGIILAAPPTRRLARGYIKLRIAGWLARGGGMSVFLHPPGRGPAKPPEGDDDVIDV